MNNIKSDFYQLLRSKRREAGLTQGELAVSAKCTQSAISMFEAGHADAISEATINRIAEKLGINAAEIYSQSAKENNVLKYCPIDDCPSNVPYVTGGMLRFKPTMVQAPENAITRCALCGEILQKNCPTTGCQTPVNEASFCSACGAAYITATVQPTIPLDDWARERRKAISELYDLTQTRISSVANISEDSGKISR